MAKKTENLKEVNISKKFMNYSQRNNKISPNTSCGPTNFIQAMEYAGWQWLGSRVKNGEQPEDALTKFCRTNKDVLAYYEKNYNSMYKNWMAEAKSIAKKTGKQYWEVDCPVNYPPNELHDVMSYAANLFVGYTAEHLKTHRRPVTRFYNEFDEREVVWQLSQGRPVISSVDPFKNGGGHYITFVGFTYDENATQNVLKHLFCYDQRFTLELGNIKEYIIDNTYGRFDFENKKYVAVSGNDEHITRTKMLEIVKPVMHCFSSGAPTCC